MLSNGMRQEFELCVAAGVYPLPIGATGFIAEELWNEVNRDFGKYYPSAPSALQKAFEQLGDKTKTPVELIALIQTCLNQLQQNT